MTRQAATSTVLPAIGSAIGSIIGVLTISMMLGDRLYVTAAAGTKITCRLVAVETRLGIPAQDATRTDTTRTAYSTGRSRQERP